MCEIEIAMSQSFYPNSLIHCMDATQETNDAYGGGDLSMYIPVIRHSRT